jgi:hypothetical protein
MGSGVYKNPLGKLVEEATTEIAAGKITAELTDRSVASTTITYGRYREALTKAVKAAGGGTKEQIAEASIKMRQAPYKVGGNADDYAVHFFSHLGTSAGRRVRAALEAEPPTKYGPAPHLREQARVLAMPFLKELRKQMNTSISSAPSPVLGSF